MCGDMGGSWLVQVIHSLWGVNMIWNYILLGFISWIIVSHIERKMFEGVTFWEFVRGYVLSILLWPMLWILVIYRKLKGSDNDIS